MFLLGPPDVSPAAKGAITFGCMFFSMIAGFCVQQWLIEKNYSGEAADLHRLAGPTGQHGSLPPAGALPKWLLAQPDALAPKDFHHDLPCNYIRSAVADAAAARDASWRHHCALTGMQRGQVCAFGSSAERRPLSNGDKATLKLYDEREHSTRG